MFAARQTKHRTPIPPSARQRNDASKRGCYATNHCVATMADGARAAGRRAPGKQEGESGCSPIWMMRMVRDFTPRREVGYALWIKRRYSHAKYAEAQSIHAPFWLLYMHDLYRY